MKRFVLLWLLFVPSAPLAHESESTGRQCYYGNLLFSPGAEVAIGNLRYMCTAEGGNGVWERSLNTKLVPLCLHSGELTALGGVMGSGKEGVSCLPNGMWER